jgi:hypothetical protein
MTQTQERITQLQQELRYLWRPEDRLLTYVQLRLAELAQLGVVPSAAQQWQDAPEGEPV